MAEHTRHPFLSRVETACDWIVQFFQEHPLFQRMVLTHMKVHSNNSIGINLSLGDKTYASCYYVYEEDEDNTVARITWVESAIGKSTGFFLVHLHLLLAVLGGANEITLDNDTDNVLQARQGIYQLLQVNNRGMNAEEKAQMTEENWAQKPEMVHFVREDSFERIRHILLNRIQQEVGKRASNRIWRPDAVEHLSLLFQILGSSSNPHHGGKSGNRKSKKSRKSRKSRKETKRHRRAI